MISSFMRSDKQPEGEALPQGRQPDIYDFLAWLEVNKGKVAAIALACVVIGFAIVTMRHFRKEKELEASTALLALKPTLVAQTNAPAQQPSEYLQMAENFAGTSAAERARYYAAVLLFTDGKYAEAETAFSNFLQENGGSPWASAAAYGVAAAQDAQKKPEALASYRNVSTAYPNSAVAEQAKLALARNYEASNQPEQALMIYNELSASRPGDMTGEPANPEAMQRKMALLRNHPNLDTNRVTAPPLSVAPSTPAQTNSATAATGSTNPPPATTAPAQE